MDTQRELVINTAWCKGCGICVAFCPKEVLEIVDGKVKRKDGPKGEGCILCSMCELRCPDYAIYIDEDEKELEADQWVKSY